MLTSTTLPEYNQVQIRNADGVLVGFIQEMNGEPTLVFNAQFRNHITLNELDIALDNWNQVAPVVA